MRRIYQRATILQSAHQWLGYLVAGGVGAVLTLVFQKTF